MSIVKNGQIIGKYTVQSIIKENAYTETYRAEDEDGNAFFFKLFVVKRMPEKLLNPETGKVCEIEYCQKLNHRGIASYVDSGTYEAEEGSCQYYLTNYFHGELLSERIRREGKLSGDEALRIYRQMLEALQFMHELSPSLSHNDITPRNVMLAPDGAVEIIDLGHVSPPCNGIAPFDTADLDICYSAGETFIGTYDAQSDIFAATAVLYTMLTGRKPWEVEFTDAMKRSRRIMLTKDFRKEHPLDFDALDVEERVKVVLAKGLALHYNDRYKSVAQIIADLDGTVAPERPQEKKKEESAGTDNGGFQRREESPNKTDFEIRRGTGNGFKDIAGMTELKDYLTQRVIFVIKDRERAEKYRLVPPNGMLLYGPPGCGKTFVAEKFAEETGFNFALVKSSDLASSYLHGSQEKFDALVPDRGNPGSQYVTSEVNEFLSQLNNCSQRGIFVVATSNRPDKIDPAVLRTGRIDKQVYVPLPDKEARREMFKLHLDGRPCTDVDADRLAELTEGYIASDIAYIVNDAAMTAAFTDQPISEAILETAVGNTRPSLRRETLRTFEDIRDRMEGIERSNIRRPIGFTV